MELWGLRFSARSHPHIRHSPWADRRFVFSFFPSRCSYVFAILLLQILPHSAPSRLSYAPPVVIPSSHRTPSSITIQLPQNDFRKVVNCTNQLCLRLVIASRPKKRLNVRLSRQFTNNSPPERGPEKNILPAPQTPHFSLLMQFPGVSIPNLISEPAQWSFRRLRSRAAALELSMSYIWMASIEERWKD